MAKFTYRGKTIEELKAMSVEEFAKLIPSRQRKSIAKGMVQKKLGLFEKIKKANEELAKGNVPKIIKIHRKDLVILPSMVGLTFGVHTGKEFKNVEITQQMVGCYLGEFILTRQRVKHSAPGIGATRSSMFVPIK